jgi:hypothetical protein
MMRMTLYVFPVFLLVSVTRGLAQEPTSDAAVREILTQSVNASQTSQVQSFTATGIMTFHWAGRLVQANATIRGRGHAQFRIDAEVPGGTLSFAINGISSVRKEANGRLTQIPLHNTISKGGTTFPYLAINAAMADQAATISDRGVVESDARQLHRVRIMRNAPATHDPDGLIAKLSPTDYFLDPQTNLVVGISDMTHPIQTFGEEYLREMELEDYSTINGVAVPTRVREKITGHTTWEFHLLDITFNTNLTDEDFSIQ